jgi:hypothetical protein
MENQNNKVLENFQNLVEVDGANVNPNIDALKKAREEFEIKMSAPEGFVEVRLSTKGLIGAPEVFYIRNFSPEDLMSLGLADQEDIPLKLIKVLDSLIYNPENDPALSVKNFHEKEVIELLLFLYETFYTTIFANQEWILTEEDWDYVEKMYGGRDTDDFRNYERALKNGSFKPTFDIDISKIEFYEIEKDIKLKAQVSRKYGDKTFKATFTLPKFGDFITLKYFIDSIYKEEDRKFARIGEIIKFRREMEEKLQQGENVNLSSIPNVPKAELDKFKEYEMEKTLFSITASKALYICEFDGVDVSSWPLEKKLDLAKDARLDYSVFKMVQDHFNTLKFGYKEDITVHDPIIGKVVTRKYTFQLVDLLAAIRDTGAAETSISFV